MQNLRVAIVTRRFWPLVGAAEREIALLALALARQGTRPTIVTPRWNPDWSPQFFFGGLPAVRIAPPPRSAWGGYRFAAAVRTWLQSRRGTFAAVCLAEADDVAVRLEAALRKIAPAIIVRAENGAPVRPPWAAATTLAVSTPALAERLRRGGIPADRIAVLGKGTRVRPWPDGAERMRQRRGLADAHWEFALAEDTPLAVWYGALEREARLETLIDAWAAVVRRRPAARLWLLGEGPLRGALIDRIHRRELRGRVVLPGAFDNVDDLLRAADLFVLPGEQQGLSLPLLDAMAAPLPVIAADSPGNRLPIVHEESGLLVPPGEAPPLAAAILRLLDAPALAARLAAGAWQTVTEHYAIDAVARRYAELFVRIGTHARPEGSRRWDEEA